jgi:hypothetical protein
VNLRTLVIVTGIVTLLLAASVAPQESMKQPRPEMLPDPGTPTTVPNPHLTVGETDER